MFSTFCLGWIEEKDKVIQDSGLLCFRAGKTKEMRTGV